MWFDNWQGVARVLVIGVVAYLALIALLRLSGKRTLSKLNAFDLVVTVALGSTLATILLSKDVALAEGLAAFAVLIVGQYVAAWLAVRSKTVHKVLKSDPQVLVWRGQVASDALRRERVTLDEVKAVVRGAGLGAVEQAGVVVLESDGSFHVLPMAQANDSAVPGPDSSEAESIP